MLPLPNLKKVFANQTEDDTSSENNEETDPVDSNETPSVDEETTSENEKNQDVVDEN